MYKLKLFVLLDFCPNITLNLFLSEKEFTQDLRDSLPLICAEDGIIYVPGVCVRDGYKGKSEPCLTIRVYSLSTL